MGPEILRDLTFDIPKHSFQFLTGPSGAGKTTLMNILFGQYTADSGTVAVFGETLPPGNSRAALDAGVGMVHHVVATPAKLASAGNATRCCGGDATNSR